MALTQLHIDYRKFVLSNPSVTNEEAAQALETTTARIEKVRTELDAHDDLPTGNGISKFAEALLLLALENKISPPAEQRVVAEGWPFLHDVQQAASVPPEITQAAMKGCGAAQDMQAVIATLDLLNLDREATAKASKDRPVLVSLPDDLDEIEKAWKTMGLVTHRINVAKAAHLTILDVINRGNLPPKTQPIAAFKESSEGLFEKGLAVRVVNQANGYGIALTRAGFELAERIRSFQLESEINMRRLNHRPTKIYCSTCRDYFLQTTIWFDKGTPVTGKMLTTCGPAEAGSWSLEFGTEDTGESLLCPNCHKRIVDENGMLPEECLHEIKN